MKNISHNISKAKTVHKFKTHIELNINFNSKDRITVKGNSVLSSLYSKRPNEINFTQDEIREENFDKEYYTQDNITEENLSEEILLDEITSQENISQEIFTDDNMTEEYFSQIKLSQEILKDLIPFSKQGSYPKTK